MVDDSVPNPSAGDEPHDEDNTVGYGKPPKEHQFQPGHSGNPSGRPRGRKATQSLAATLAQVMSRTHRVVENGRRKKVTGSELFVAQLLRRSLTNSGAANGAAKLLLRLTEQPEYEAAQESVPDFDWQPIVNAMLALMNLDQLRELRAILPPSTFSPQTVPKSQHVARRRPRK